MSHRPFDLTRRAVSRILLALPLAPIAAADESKPTDAPSPSPRDACLAAAETGLSADERARLEKSLAGGEKPLAVVRDFKLPPDVAPALRFQPMKSRGK